MVMRYVLFVDDTTGGGSKDCHFMQPYNLIKIKMNVVSLVCCVLLVISITKANDDDKKSEAADIFEEISKWRSDMEDPEKYVGLLDEKLQASFDPKVS